MRNQIGRNIIEQEGQRVLTTAQLAESYGTTADKISYNFKYNEKRYEEGKHFFVLTGEVLKSFKKANREFQGSLNKLYLWTEKGAWLHAKSLNTDEAWDAYEMLVDDYYRLKETVELNRPSYATEDPITLALQAALDTRAQVQTLQEDVNTLKNTMRIDVVEQMRIHELGKNKVIKALGGYRTPAYNELSAKTFRKLWKDFKQYFLLPRYSELPKAQLEQGIQFINLWEPDAALKMEILAVQRQLTLQE